MSVHIKCHCFLHLPPPKNLLCECLIIIQSPSVFSIYRSLSCGPSVIVWFSFVHIATLYRLVLVLVGHLPFVPTIIFGRIFSDLKCNELLYWSVNNSLLSTFREYLQLGTSNLTVLTRHELDNLMPILHCVRGAGSSSLINTTSPTTRLRESPVDCFSIDVHLS